jgi:hypothetical protein
VIHSTTLSSTWTGPFEMVTDRGDDGGSQGGAVARWSSSRIDGQNHTTVRTSTSFEQEILTQ